MAAGAAGPETEMANPHVPSEEDLRVISLGSWCGIRGVVREMELPGANLPFDWLRCSLDGVIHAIQTDFEDFLSFDYTVNGFEREQPVPRDYLHDNADESILPFKHVYVSWSHSFWHDDLDLQEEREKYQGRIERFRKLKTGSSMQPLLFIRAANATSELAGIHVLHDVLSAHFASNRAYLLVVFNHQPTQCAIFFDDRPTLVVHTLGRRHDGEGLHGMKPLYRSAINCGIALALGKGFAVAHDEEGSSMEHRRYSSLFALLRDIKAGLFEDVVLGEDLSKQWSHVSQAVQQLDSNALSLFDAVERCLRGADVRRSPYDGKCYEFAGLLETCKPGWATEEVEDFWHQECTPLLGRYVADDVSGNPQEAAESLIHGRLLERGSVEIDNGMVTDSRLQMRQNPYDCKVYDFEAFVKECSPQWSPDEVTDFWYLNCVPLNTWGSHVLSSSCAVERQFAQSLRVVSLGSHCGLKHTLIKMGLSSATYPFDWLRTSLTSVIQALHTDFERFVDYKQVIPHYERPRILNDDELAKDDHTPFEVIYACDGHAFWHSILWDSRDLASCHRRTQRLLRLRKSTEAHGPLLFIRAASAGSELAQLDQLMRVLRLQFGEDVFLLHMLTSQPSYETIFFRDDPHLVVATLGSAYCEHEEYMGVIPLYHEAIWDMIWYIQRGQRAKKHIELQCLTCIAQHVGLLFEDNVDISSDTRKHWSPVPSNSVENVVSFPGAVPPLLRSAVGEVVGNASEGFRRLCPDVGAVRAISLGSWCGVKAAIHELAFNKVNLPFDWVRCSLEGVMHALKIDFSDFLQYERVIRRHGQDQAGQALFPNLPPDAAVFSPPRHEDIYATWGWSFWYDNMTSEQERMKYVHRVQRLQQLRSTEGHDSTTAAPLLFIRAVNSSDELSRASDLLRLLEEQFGRYRSHLLMLASCQPRHCLLFFEDHPKLLVQTFCSLYESDTQDDLAGMLPLYTEAITNALHFVLTKKRPCEHEAFSSLAGFLAATPFDRQGRPVFQTAVLEEDLTKQWSPRPAAATGQSQAQVHKRTQGMDGMPAQMKWDATENQLYELVE